MRADFNDPKRRVNMPMTVKPDGTELVEQRIFIGGHPEWDFRSRMIGRVEDKLVLYDTLKQEIVETIGGPEMFRDPEGDTALSRDGRWIVNGAPTGATMHYTIMRRADRAFIKTEEFQPHGLCGRRPAHRSGAALEPRRGSVRVPGAGEGRHAADVRSRVIGAVKSRQA